MPFKSKKQVAKFAELVKKGKMKQSTFDEHLKATQHLGELPDRLTPEKVKIDPKYKGGRHGR